MPETINTNQVLLDFFDRLAQDPTVPVGVAIAAGTAGQDMRGKT